MTEAPGSETPRSLLPAHRISERFRRFAPLLTPVLLASFVFTFSTPVNAGDILRGGKPAVRPSVRAAELAGGQSRGERGAANSKNKQQDRLSRTTKAVLDVQKMQAQARKIAQRKGGEGVPNGLQPGGLELLKGGRYTGAKDPVEKGRSVTIEQNRPQAILDWKTFNVGSKTKLIFDQSRGESDAGKWVAFNRVTDPSGKPSQILGSIKAEGQVYVINQNGIVFGGGSQVNVHALVASSLPVNDNLIQRGLINNPDGQFLFTAISIPPGIKGTPAFRPEAPLTEDGRIGDVIVKKGAQLISPTSDAKIGGKIALIGPNVENHGTIFTPDGQTILAAGLQVGFAPHPSTDPSLRGLDIYIGKVGDYAATATNNGFIDSPRGSVVISGKTVNQLGIIDSSTSVSLNGRIDLLADYNSVPNVPDNVFNQGFIGGARNLDPFLFLPGDSGTVNLGKGSVMRILPEYESKEAVVGTELTLRSQINVQAKTIYAGKNSQLLAPNALVNFSAGDWNLDLSNSSLPRSNFIYNRGQIYVDESALIDVAGSTEVLVPISQNVLTLTLLGAEFADSPLQRDGPLRGSEIKVDVRKTGVFNGRFWVGTPLGDATGFAGLIERSVAELTTAGGSVTMNAGNSVVVRKGANVDVSGGYVRFEDGFIETSKVLYNGQLIDIAAATPDLAIQGIFTGMSIETHPRWGISVMHTNPISMLGGRFEEGYLQGADAGSIAIRAPSMAIDGTLTGTRVTGPRQFRSGSNTSDLARGGSLSLAFLQQDRTDLEFFRSPTPPTITFTREFTLPEPEEFELEPSGEPLELIPERVAAVELSPRLMSKDGFTELIIDNKNGDIFVPKGLTLNAEPGSAISIAGANITIDGSIVAPGGSLTFATYNLDPDFVQEEILKVNYRTPPPAIGRGIFTLGQNAVLDTSGLIVDDRSGGDSQTMRLSGGTVSISGYTVQLANRSEVNVSGGASASTTGALTYGDGGSITIASGKDLSLASVLGGELELSGKLIGFAGGRAGSLSLQAQIMQVGGKAAYENTFLLQPEFFSEGGFGRYAVIGFGAADLSGERDFIPALTLVENLELAPISTGLVARAEPGSRLRLRQVLRAPGVRTPVSLAFSATGIREPILGGLVARGDLLVGEGSSIETDPAATVSFSGQTVNFLGSVSAPSGTITISGGSDSKSVFPGSVLSVRSTVFLGEKSHLSTAGTRVLTPDPLGRLTGSILPGGSITISGNIVAVPGSTLDVSGSSGTLDLPVETALEPMEDTGILNDLTNPPTIVYVRTRVESNAGSITFNGAQALFSDATLIAEAGGRSALGGNLSIGSGRFVPDGTVPDRPQINLIVSQDQRVLEVLPESVGTPITDNAGDFVQGLGRFSVDRFDKGGFDSLALNGVVQFEGPVKIDARRELSVASTGLLVSDSDVELNAAHVTLGTAFQPPEITKQLEFIFDNQGSPLFLAPEFGPGKLRVEADLIDVGNTLLLGIGKADLIARNGDIRGNGTFNMAGDLTMKAGQIYPVTAASFNVTAYDYKDSDGNAVDGSITIEAAGRRQIPYSAGGSLNLYASRIVQGGTVRAPIGSINIGWDGSGTRPTDILSGTTLPFPVADEILLTKGSETSVSAVDPITGEGIVIPYGISEDGISWTDPTGADITARGVATKNILVSGTSLGIERNSAIDLRGGGDLYAFRWIAGNGGRRDLLGQAVDAWDAVTAYDPGALVLFNGASWSALQSSTGETPSANLFWSLVPSTYAVIADYEANYIPYAPFNGNSDTDLGVGDRVFLQGSSTLAQGNYTLLPARYALLPGGVQVSPKVGLAVGSVPTAEGADMVSGYRYNDLNSKRKLEPLYARFEVAGPKVVAARAQYENFFGSKFLDQRAEELGVNVARLPDDAGKLVLQASENMTLRGIIRGAGGEGARGAEIDISTPTAIIIGSDKTAPDDALVLNPTLLSSYEAESFLIGGSRDEEGNVTVVSSDVRVNNKGNPLSSPEIILVSRQSLSMAPNSEILQVGEMGGDAALLSFSGRNADGAVIRVSADPNASIVREGFKNLETVSMRIGAGAKLTGASVILDSTFATELSPSARILADSVTLGSGQISLLLNDSVKPNPTPGLVLAGGALEALRTANSLSLLSYSSIDLYGAGQFRADSKLAISAGEIRGFKIGEGTVTLGANELLLENAADAKAVGSNGQLSGSLVFNSDVIRIGDNQFRVSQFKNVDLDAPAGLILEGEGRFTTQGDMTVSTTLLTAEAQAVHGISARGSLAIRAPNSEPKTAVVGGLGADITLEGSSVTVDSPVMLPSGLLEITATRGDLNVNGSLSVAGVGVAFYDVVRYTDAGQITLNANQGSVNIGAASQIDVSAQSGGGNAGAFVISAPRGSIQLGGQLSAMGGNDGTDGVFSLDIGRLPEIAALSDQLNEAGFFQSRSIRVRNGDVLINGTTTAHNFALSADQGTIAVSGEIDASGVTGGSIHLAANGSLIVRDGAILSVRGEQFSNAQKGGRIVLEAGTQRNGEIDRDAMLEIQAGSKIDLSVAANEGLGQFTGTLHLRAPQTANERGIQMSPIDGTITGASSILVEGYKLYDLTEQGGDLTIPQGEMLANGQAFLEQGTDYDSYVAMLKEGLFRNNRDLVEVVPGQKLRVVYAPGAEIINRNGDLTLGEEFSGEFLDWDLSTYRFGPTVTVGLQTAPIIPGVLTLRAAGNLAFFNALTDGFSLLQFQYNASLLRDNLVLPSNTQSWSYRLAAGSDLAAADFKQVIPLSDLPGESGSLLLGKNNETNSSENEGSFFPNPPGSDAITSTAIENRFQVIRTGAGNIDIATGRDVQILNQFSTIYTAGVRAPNWDLNGTFEAPNSDGSGVPEGNRQQQEALFPVTDEEGNPVVGSNDRQIFVSYPAQYNWGGGDVSIAAQGDIARYTVIDGVKIADSQRQMPNNWLYKRGSVDPSTGQFVEVPVQSDTGVDQLGDIASTTWWIDFSNFFQGVGALGGGNISMVAGGDVANVDAVIPTNARMPKGTPNASKLVEFGGGDLLVSAGRNIDGGVYYVERGNGSLIAGNAITTNSTRTPSTGILDGSKPLAKETWLPTTLFVGKGKFDVSARGDVLLGPVANPLLLPSGINNSYWYKTYFSTYSPDSSLHATSLAGDVTLRQFATGLAGDGGSAQPLLSLWYNNQLLFTGGSLLTTAAYQPWNRLSETSVDPFATSFALMPATVKATSFSGDINVVGNLTLTPAPRGGLELLASKSISGLQPNGRSTFQGGTRTWGYSTINLSDADPARIQSVGNPLGYQSTVPVIRGTLLDIEVTGTDFLIAFDSLFSESGSIQGEQAVLETKQTLHASQVLHRGDNDPVRLYASRGDLSGLTLFAPKKTSVFAGNDLTDASFYIQNLEETDVSTVAVGRDIIASNANSPLRTAATAPGNILNESQTIPNLVPAPALAGDIQVSGPGELQVLAGRNLDLGAGLNNEDGTGSGINSIGNARNPALPFAGAAVTVAAGIGSPENLYSGLDGFLETVPEEKLPEYLKEIGVDSLENLTADQTRAISLKLFYLTLRDSGRDSNNPDSENFGNYDAGYAAIETVFGNAFSWDGEIFTKARDIRTKSGGAISILAPGGGLTLATSIIGTPLAPPGIITESGGAIDIFTHESVDIGVSRIFTLRGGDEIIWSSTGDIAAGSSSRTVRSAPPTRVLIDPQSADVETDLAGLATGGGIGVLATVAGVAPGNVDLIAPEGVVDAGDAGIRSTGNLNIAATAVVNAANISFGGQSAGVPSAPSVSAPSIGAVTAASNASAATSNAAADLARESTTQAPVEEAVSIITVEVLGYGGSEEEEIY